MVAFVVLAVVWVVAGVPVGGAVANRLADWLHRTSRRGPWSVLLIVVPLGLYGLVPWTLVRLAFVGL